MAARDHSSPLRRAMIAAVKASAACVAIQDDRCFDYVPTSPRQPYTRVEYPYGIPYEMTCGTGGELVIQVSGFTAGDPGVLSAALIAALDEQELPLDTGYILSLTLDSFQALQDQADQTLKHLVLKFRAITLEELT
jgi:hypothetical protein